MQCQQRNVPNSVGNFKITNKNNKNNNNSDYNNNNNNNNNK